MTTAASGGHDDVDAAAGDRGLQPAVQRERLDEPGGVDLLHRDAAEGALVEVAQLEHRGRAIADAEQVLEQRQAVAAGGQDDRVDVVLAEDLGQLGELTHDRHDRVREIADEADELDAVRLALLEGLREPGGLFARAQAQHTQRALGRPHAMPPHVPAGDREEADQGGGGEPERLGARVQQGGGSDDECRDECGGLGMTDESNGEGAVVLTAIAQEGRADHPGDGGRGDGRHDALGRSTERESPGKQDHQGEDELGGPLPSDRKRTRRQRHRIGDGSDVRGTGGDCHAKIPMLVG